MVLGNWCGPKPVRFSLSARTVIFPLCYIRRSEHRLRQSSRRDLDLGSPSPSNLSFAAGPDLFSEFRVNFQRVQLMPRIFVEKAKSGVPRVNGLRAVPG